MMSKMVFDENLYSVALSISSSPASNNIWELLSLDSPSKAYENVIARAEIETQGFISTMYPGSPIDAAKAICDSCSRSSIKIIDYWDDNYPALLKEIEKPPIVLYCKGNMIYERSIAIVGTRKSDKLSREICRRLSKELSLSGFTIVSGMAVGIDREAHIGALQNNCPTIGVLANGIGIEYPSANRDVYNAIQSSDNSCLISEYPPGIYAGRWTFVRRNRIISGLSIGTVIVKAGLKSGALITARYALEQNREVFACPGMTFDKDYSGCFDLIKSGAHLVSATEDIYKELSNFNHSTALTDENVNLKSHKNNFDLSDHILNKEDNFEDKYAKDSLERKVVDLLKDREIEIDSIVRLLDSSTKEVNEVVTLLELSGVISRDGNMLSRY